ncbi:MobA/MobL family protein [Dyella sp. C9]|uniref:MobA/MobL family protein n=1 Tax=Dyella sp. C9 TaxID=2202154 RepID=UPI000DEECF61|nr:MobA/MobL family protein [Dyella sp. C9]
MDIHAHARPHLEVHSRSKGHSAVAGAAYRLGLRLYDERQKCWHDFQKRALGEEIVRALTVAPTGSPSWCTDPQELWSRVERAERRCDSQVARDYRIPLPLGLSDQDAGGLAEEMARFICDELNTPVSLGLHRDADRDALGNLKPIERQGFHAHLYFPTRPLLDVAEGDDGKGAASMGFGPKLHEFSKQHLGSAFIELLNCRWSELANDYARKAGSDAKYEYKSYKRLGVTITPQPTLGQGATALERRGVYTSKGDNLREALVMARVYEKAHAGSLDAQHVQALRDVRREGGKGSQRQTEALPKFATSHFKSRKSPAVTQPFITRQGSLAYRLRASAPSPKNKEEADELERSLVLVEALDKAFAVYHELMQQLDEVLKSIEVARAEKLSAEYQADQSHQHRSKAQVRLSRWEEDHRWRVRMFASMGGSPLPEHGRLRDEVRRHDEHVQSLKRSIAQHASEVVTLELEASALKTRQADVVATIRNAVVKLHGQSVLFPEIIKALPDSGRALVKEQLPTMFEASEPIDEVQSLGLTSSPTKKDGMHP